MSDKLSFHVCSRQADHMNSFIAAEARGIVMEAAAPVQPGETIKAQLNRAWQNLGRPAFWRVRAAWYGEAGSFSGAAIADLQQRFVNWKAREARRAAETAATRELIRNNGRRAAVENARAEYQDLMRRVEQLEATLRLRSADAMGVAAHAERGAAGGADCTVGGDR